jgi:RNA polymerase sigma factor (sigma-70 family)
MVDRRRRLNRTSPISGGWLSRLPCRQFVASQAVFEYWRAIDRGDQIDNPEGYVTTVAERRAKDALRKWMRDRGMTQRIADDDVMDHPMFIQEWNLPDADDELPTSAEIRSMFDQAVGEGGDEIDLRIARAIWLQGLEVSEVALELGMAEKTVRNRMTAIRSRVTKAIGENG